jgi:hypothetical protein
MTRYRRYSRYDYDGTRAAPTSGHDDDGARPDRKGRAWDQSVPWS